MEILYSDDRVLVAVKPPRVLSTDEAGGMPELLRQALGDPAACVRTVHRLDRVVGGVMVFARTKRAAGDLSRQIREGRFEKEYLAVLQGIPGERFGTLRDLLARDPAEHRTYVASQPGKDVREAVLQYETLAVGQGLALVKIRLVTGRTHQIRVQFSSRGLPLVGDRKYGPPEQRPDGEIALWSHRLRFYHPRTGEAMDFCRQPPDWYPWNLFSRDG